jgi:hydrophobe/amphiphile efflux-3 (HAE3) family protein
MFKWISETVVRFPWLYILLFLLITVFFGSFLHKAEIDPELENDLPLDFPSRVSMNMIEDIFGGNEMIMIVLTADDVLNPDTLRRTKEISKRMERLNHVDRVLSLFELKYIRGQDGEMLVDPAVKRIPRTNKAREALRDSIKDNDLVYGNVVAKDFTATAVIGLLTIEASDREVLSEVEGIIADVPGPEPVMIAGAPYVRTIMGYNMQEDMSILMPLGLIVMLFFLFICFRQLRGVLLPFLVVVMSIILSMGIIPLMGWKIHMLTTLLPVMLIAIANDYGIHLIAKYQEDNPPGNTLTSKDLAKRMIQDLGSPVLFTAVTTMAGMLCLLMHIVVPAKQLGILMAVSIAYAFLGSITFIPAVIVLIPKARPIIDLKGRSGKRTALDQALLSTSRFVSKRPKLIIMSTVATIAAVSTGIYSLEVETNPVNFFSSDAPLPRSAHMVNKHFGGADSISVVAKGDIKDPALLRQINELERSLESQPHVGITTSLARVIRRMNKVMNDGDSAFDRIPDTKEAIAQYLLLYSMGGDPDDFDRMVDFPYEHAQIMARVNTTSSKEISHVVRYAQDYLERHPGSPFTIVGGHCVFITDFIEGVVMGQVLSLSASLLVITLLVTVLFRSFVAGLMASLTLGLAMVVLFGLMGYLGINLDVPTALLSAIMIGVGVDYMIHYLWRYRKERQSGKAPEVAVVSTLTTVGRGIVFNALSVAVGFTVLFISNFLPIRFIAFLVLVSIFACLIGALVLLPSICLVFKPKFLDPNPDIK